MFNHPIRQALGRHPGLTLHHFAGTGEYARYVVRLHNASLGLVLGSGWTCGGFAAFAPWTGRDFDFDREIRLASSAELEFLFAALAQDQIQDLLASSDSSQELQDLLASSFKEAA